MLSFMFYQANGSCNDDSKGAQSALDGGVDDGFEAHNVHFNHHFQPIRSHARCLWAKYLIPSDVDFAFGSE